MSVVVNHIIDTDNTAHGQVIIVNTNFNFSSDAGYTSITIDFNPTTSNVKIIQGAPDSITSSISDGAGGVKKFPRFPVTFVGPQLTDITDIILTYSVVIDPPLGQKHVDKGIINWLCIFNSLTSPIVNKGSYSIPVIQALVITLFQPRDIFLDQDCLSIGTVPMQYNMTVANISNFDIECEASFYFDGVDKNSFPELFYPGSNFWADDPPHGRLYKPFTFPKNSYYSLVVNVRMTGYQFSTKEFITYTPILWITGKYPEGQNARVASTSGSVKIKRCSASS